MRGDGPPAPAAAAADPGWQWWSGPNDEWYTDGPFATRAEAVAALDGAAGYVIEGHPPVPIHLSAEQLLKDEYFENNDHFDFDHAEPGRRGDEAAIIAANAELQVLFDRWYDRHGHTFTRGNLFGSTRNDAAIKGDAAMVETHSTIAGDYPAAPAASTDGAR